MADPQFSTANNVGRWINALPGLATDSIKSGASSVGNVGMDALKGVANAGLGLAGQGPLPSTMGRTPPPYPTAAPAPAAAPAAAPAPAPAMQTADFPRLPASNTRLVADEQAVIPSRGTVSGGPSSGINFGLPAGGASAAPAGGGIDAGIKQQMDYADYVRNSMTQMLPENFKSLPAASQTSIMAQLASQFAHASGVNNFAGLQSGLQQTGMQQAGETARNLNTTGAQMYGHTLNYESTMGTNAANIERERMSQEGAGARTHEQVGAQLEHTAAGERIEGARLGWEMKKPVTYGSAVYSDLNNPQIPGMIGPAAGVYAGTNPDGTPNFKPLGAGATASSAAPRGPAAGMTYKGPDGTHKLPNGGSVTVKNGMVTSVSN